MASLLDTDILSAIMRRNNSVMPKSRAYLQEHQRFHFSIITRYEILRGLKAIDAHRRLETFEQLCLRSTVIHLSDAIISLTIAVFDINSRYIGKLARKPIYGCKKGVNGEVRPQPRSGWTRPGSHQFDPLEHSSNLPVGDFHCRYTRMNGQWAYLDSHIEA